MPQGIKLSNQLYPATESKILSQAEYIHDSQWEEQKKDQQSINKSLNDRILESGEDLTSYINSNLVNGINSVTPSIGLKDVTTTSIQTDEDGKITSISPRKLGICDTIYAYQDNDSNNSYPGVIKGIIRGDINRDGKVSIQDVTQLINILLKGETNVDPVTISMELKNPNSTFFDGIQVNNTETIPVNGNIRKVFVKLKSSTPINTNQQDLNNVNVSNDDSEIENYIKLCRISSILKNTNSQNEGFKYYINIIGYEDSNQTRTDFNPTQAYNDFILEVFPNDVPENNEVIFYKDTSEIGELVNVNIQDPGGLLAFPNQGIDGIKIGEVTALINYVLSGKWNDSTFYSYFSSDNFYLIDNQNNPIPVSTGIIYQAVEVTTNNRYYFIAYEQDYTETNNKLYFLQVKVKNIDSEDLLQWLQNTLLVIDESNTREKYTSYILFGTFDKLNDNQVKQAVIDLNDNNDSQQWDTIFSEDNINKILEVQNVSNTIEVPVYFYRPRGIQVLTDDQDNQVLLYNFPEACTITVSLDEDNPAYFKDNLDNLTKSLTFRNLNVDYPYIVLPITFNTNNLDYYEYNNGFYNLKENVQLHFKYGTFTNQLLGSFVNSLSINCKANNL